MNEVQFKKILNQYKVIFDSIVSDMTLDKIYAEDDSTRVIFSNQKGKKVNGLIRKGFCVFTFENEYIAKKVSFRIPDEEENAEFVFVNEIINEKRCHPHGTNNNIIEKIEKVYGYSVYSKNELALLDLVSKRYVFNAPINMNIFYSDLFMESKAIMITTFESHMKKLIKFPNSLRWLSDTISSSKVILNGINISGIYDLVDGIDKISRTYDLYRGIITKANCDDIFAIHLGLIPKEAFGYKDICGITQKEEELCGKFIGNNPYDQDKNLIIQLIKEKMGYIKPFNPTNIIEVSNAITYDIENLEIHEDEEQEKVRSRFSNIFKKKK